MTYSALQFTKREMRGIVFSPSFWMILIPISMVLGLAGPFGTFAILDVAPRLAYWLTIAFSTFAVGYAIILFLVKAYRPEQLFDPLPNAIAGLAAGVPVTIVVWLINEATLGDKATVTFLPLLVYCSLISAAVSPSVAHFARPKATADPPAPNAARRPRILDRLPLEKRGALSHVSVQDHYVEVHTDRGSALILMRLADAIGETEGVEGLQVHRSHWVARDAIAKLARSEGRTTVQLKDGTILPVSRSYAPTVKEAGLA